MRELPEARVWADRALARFPRSADLLAARAVVQSRAGLVGDAMASSDEAIGAPDASALTWAARGEVLLEISRTSAAACFQKAIEAGGRDPAVPAAIGRACAVRGLWTEALHYWRAAADRDAANPMLMCWVGRCCEHLGDAVDARRAYTQAMLADPRCKPARDALRDLDRAPIFRRLRRFLTRVRNRRRR